MPEPETNTTALEREYRDEAAKPVHERLEADGRRVPDLAPYLRTIGERMFDHNFDINALWREHNVRDNGTSARFARLGTTPKVYLTDCRLSVAARLLVHTSLRVNRIIPLVGYSSPAPFCTAFKKWSRGLTPGQYRKNPDYDPDPESWCDPIDLSEVQAALEGRLNRREGLALCHRLLDHLLDMFEPDVRTLLTLADAAQSRADFETARRYLKRAARHSEGDAFEIEIHARLALITYCRDALLTLALDGDVDRQVLDEDEAPTMSPRLAVA